MVNDFHFKFSKLDSLSNLDIAPLLKTAHYQIRFLFIYFLSLFTLLLFDLNLGCLYRLHIDCCFIVSFLFEDLKASDKLIRFYVLFLEVKVGEQAHSTFEEEVFFIVFSDFLVHKVVVMAGSVLGDGDCTNYALKRRTFIDSIGVEIEEFSRVVEPAVDVKLNFWLFIHW